MSEKTMLDMEEAREREEYQRSLQRARLHKANNVQRRKFEKMAEELVNSAKRKQRNAANDERIIATKAVVREVMGEDYDILMEIRARIQSCKQQIAAYQERAELVRTRLRKKGIKCSDGYRDTQWNYYINPPVNDKVEDDACSTVVGDPTIALDILECRANEAFPKLERRLLDIKDEALDLEAAGETLQLAIWQLVTAEEIVEEINNFRGEWDV